MEPDDPFGWITDLCRGSSSEDNRSRSPSYFGQPDSDGSNSDSDQQKTLDIPVASTGITMVSLPGTPEDEAPNGTDALPEDEEIFHTPPESRSTSASFDNCNDDQMFGADLYNAGDTVSDDADSGDSRKAVDLGQGTDLGFSEVEVGVDLTQRIEVDSCPNNAFRRESEENRVSKRGFFPEGQSSTRPLSKKLKSLDFESPIDLGTPEEENSEEILRSLKKWKLEMDSLSPGASSELELENQQNHESKAEVGEGRVDLSTQVIDSEDGERHMERENNNGVVSDGEKSLNFWSKDMECDLEERNPFSDLGNDYIRRNSGKSKKTPEVTDQSRYVGDNGSSSREMEEKTKRKRELPSWLTGRVGADERVEINEQEAVHTNMGSNNLSNDGSNLPQTGGKVEGKRVLPSWATGRVVTFERVEINEQEAFHANMDLNKLSNDGSNLPHTGGKVEGKRALPSWAVRSMEADGRAEAIDLDPESLVVNETEQEIVEVNETERERAEVNETEPEGVEVNETEPARVEVNETEPERVEVNERGSTAPADTVSGGLRRSWIDTMVLNVLRELTEEPNYEVDRDLACMNLWEVAKRHGWRI